MQRELIIVVEKHRKFGVLLVPYIITPSGGNALYSVIDKASPISIRDTAGYCDDYEQIIRLYGSIEDTYVARLFSKEPPSDFLRHVDKEFIASKIRPYIEVRLKKMMKFALAQHLRIFQKDNNCTQVYAADEIKVAGSRVYALFLFDRNENGIRYRIAIDHGDHYDKLKGKTALVITDEKPCNVVINKVLYQFFDIDSKKFAPFLTNDFIHIRKETENAYFEKFILNAVRNFHVRATGFGVKVVRELPKVVLNLGYSIMGDAVLTLKFQYGMSQVFHENQTQAFVDMQRSGDDVNFVKMMRQTDYEDECVELLKSFGFQTNDNINFKESNAGAAVGDESMYNLVEALGERVEQLANAGFELRQTEKKRYHIGGIGLSIKAEERNDWFDLRGTVTVGGFQIPFQKLQRNILGGIREYELPDGTVAVLPAEWFVRYFELFRVGRVAGDTLSVKRQMFGLLHESGVEAAGVERLCNMFNVGNLPKASLPAGLNANLRPYQLTGYYWMKLLKTNGFGGCLADDMGLGKTLQALTLLLDSSKDSFSVEVPTAPKGVQLSLFDVPRVLQKRPVSLIVMPLSLIHNWCAEAARFTPSLRVLAHVGQGRARDASQFNGYDVVVTTYGLVRNDCDLLSSYQFYYIILDESQAIKNASSKSYAAVISLKAKYKLVLTGTPIENSLTDLWAQMNFINPGLLGSQTAFRKEFAQIIERDPDSSRVIKLKAMVEPFILRRTKEQVASDLPPKTEQIRICDMSPEQQSLYESEKSIVRNKLLLSLTDNNLNHNSALILQSLTRLRQIACHPRLAGFDEPSAKFDEVVRVLETILSENHKVLVFSSFVEYLNIFEEHLKNTGIGYSKLTGSTHNREEVIDRFQTNSQVPVFLISLKAGGVGLNLTAADYVFILDPWWNPSAENQAIDRAHRIGQTKNVFVYKFVTAGTLEEKIITLQNRKSRLAGLFASSNPLGNLTVDDLMQLFE